MTRHSIRGEVQEISHKWGWFLVLGIVLIGLGAIALGSVWMTTLVTVVLFGWLLIAGGAFEMVAAFWSQQSSGVFLHLLAGILHFVVGIMLVTHPVASMAALTLLIAALFLTGGLFRIVAAAMVRHAAWGWAALDGLVTVILGLLIWSEWPVSALWVIGMFVGIGLVVRGWAWVMFALTARQIAHGADMFGHPQSA